nr:upf0676 protein [Quercus suber]
MTVSTEKLVPIPIIDISPSNPHAARQLLDAATSYGFVYIDNNAATGISPSAIDVMFDLSKHFFAAPRQVKEEVSISSNKAGKNHGWLGQGVEKLDPKVQKRPDVKEAFNMGYPRQDGTFEQPIPQPLHPHIPTLAAFQTACQYLCQHILTLFATALELPSPDWFTSRHDPTLGPTGTVFRLLYYPQARNEPGIDIRAGAHSDYGSVSSSNVSTFSSALTNPHFPRDDEEGKVLSDDHDHPIRKSGVCVFPSRCDCLLEICGGTRGRGKGTMPMPMPMIM